MCRKAEFTFDEGGFGFVDGHGGFEGRTRRGSGGVLRRDRHVASEAVEVGPSQVPRNDLSPTRRLTCSRDV